MSYHQYPPQQPYGAPPPGYSPQPGYQQYPPPQGYPPQQHQPYGAPPPQQYPSQGYGAPPPQQYPQQPYGAPPTPSYPPQQGYGPPSGPPPPQQYGQPYGGGPPTPQYPPQSGYGAPPPQQYGAPQQFYQPTPPSPGYGAPQIIAWNADADAAACRKAMKGFGTDEKTLIKALANKDPLQMHAIRDSYNRQFRRTLLTDVQSEVSGWLEEGLCAIIRGPLMQDVVLLHSAMDGPGTKEKVLNDVLLGRSNADLNAIKAEYRRVYRTSLESDIKADLSMKTERHFLMVLAANRAEDSAPVIPQQIDQDVMELYKATEGKIGTDELLVCNILSQRNDAQIGAIAHTYQQKFTRSLETVIKKEFSGHMEAALLQQLRTGTDKAMRDAMLLEDAMAGLGTKDHLLVNRIVRIHWNQNHMMNVKGAYRHKYHKELGARIKGETSGDYERLMLACIGEF